ncbi:MAG: hypothetical protein K9G76_09995 [Bacteroidales bacterium]|nr:hypothetical protein [Bacteroidales bacterium]MCF8404031.1 hypothetical protein [Bacteroidales bacterium]
MRILVIIAAIYTMLVSAFALNAQTNAEVVDTSKNIILFKERSWGGIFHTQGWGLKYSKGFNKTAFERRVWSVEMVEMQSPKQIRTINPYFTNSKSFIHGKLNVVFLFRGSYGNYKQLNRKPYWGGIELRMFYSGGISVGVAKPVYLYIYDINTNSDSYIVTTIERYDPENHGLDNIFGRASFTYGLDKIEFYPGLHGKMGLDFDYASYRNKLKSLEIGVMLDLFPRAIPIMAFNDPNYYFLTFYLNFNFGKRFN